MTLPITFIYLEIPPWYNSYSFLELIKKKHTQEIEQGNKRRRLKFIKSE